MNMDRNTVSRSHERESGARYCSHGLLLCQAGHWRWRADLDSVVVVGAAGDQVEDVEDAPGELAFECSEGLLVGLAVGLVAGDVGLGGRVGVFRDDRDRVFGLERAEATMDRVSARYAESFGRHRRDRVLD
jgi:hypothetical protein